MADVNNICIFSNHLWIKENFPILLLVVRLFNKRALNVSGIERCLSPVSAEASLLYACLPEANNLRVY